VTSSAWRNRASSSFQCRAVAGSTRGTGRSPLNPPPTTNLLITPSFANHAIPKSMQRLYQLLNIGVPIRHRLVAHLHQTDYGHQHPAKPQPPISKKGDRRRLTQSSTKCQDHHPSAALSQRPMPGADTKGLDRWPEQLRQIAAVRNQGVPATRAEWEIFHRRHGASVLLHHESHDTRHHRQAKNGIFSVTTAE